MTELQFLIDLLLNHKLPPATKKSLAERIGAVEAKYSQFGVTHDQAPMRSFPPPVTMQAPSTQRILDEMAANPVAAVATHVPAAMMAQATPPAQRIVGGEVQTGKSSRGPRKF